MGTKGEEERGQTARQPPDDTRQEEQASEDKRREGRKGGERDTDGLAPGGARRDGKKKEYVIFKGERREKTPPRLAKACKHCIYILLNIVAWRPFIALSFIYIRGILYIFIYILSRLMFTFLLKLMCI